MRILFIATAPDVQGDKGLAHILSGNTVELVTGAVDRAGLERALRGAQYDAVHYVGHGAKGVLALSDGEMDGADFATMLESQKALHFVFVNACNSLSIGTALHNALHVPIIAHDAAILIPAAVRFTETFYRAYRQKPDVGAAFERARDTLMRLFPDQTATPQLINGDMLTQQEITDAMQYLKSELTEAFDHFNGRLDKQDKRLASIEATVASMHKPDRMRLVLVLLTVLTVAQLLTPWLNAVFGTR